MLITNLPQQLNNQTPPTVEKNQVFVFKSRELFLNIHEATDLLEKQAAKSIM